MKTKNNYTPGEANQIRNDLEGLETMLGILNTLHYGNDTDGIEDSIEALKSDLKSRLGKIENFLIKQLA